MLLRTLRHVKRFSHTVVVVGAAFGLALGAPGAVWAGGNLVQNGGFEVYTNATGVGIPTGSGAILGSNGSTVTDWTSANNPNTGDQGGNFLYLPGTGSSADGSYNTVLGEGVALWGPYFGANNGLPATSPAGGNFIGMDGDTSYFGLLSQSISGLSVGQQYALTFYMAGAEEYPFTASVPLTAAMAVSLGSQTQDSPILTYASEGFTGWQYQTMYFIANATSETLSFMALSTPNGAPPFVLLDGVSMQSVPEPSSIVLLGVGLVGGVTIRYLRQRRRSVAV